jgi:2-polyprenyl-6-methoxyphenol hydroxylase-like FAD-dependent oxidoreductase
MSSQIETQVLIVGAGPVGLTLAMDLASRGIEVTIAECRGAGETPSVMCGQISARSMEIFRRLGVAEKLRELGLPPDFPNDVVSRTTATGIELSRVVIPSRAERRSTVVDGADTWWPTPEHTHRVNQIYFEPVLFAHAAAQQRIRILNRTLVEEFVQTDDDVTVVARDLERGKRISIAASYVVGCDGAKSMVRKSIGATLEGASVIQRVQSTYIRAPALLSLMPGKPAWMCFALNSRCCGSMMAVDGREFWLIHNFLYHGEHDFEAVDRDWAIRAILGVGPDFQYETVSKEDWIGRRLVADKLRDRRALICGDAAHLWIPHGGYGMNAGIADAANLSWMLAAALNGWAAPTILDAYEAERRPITEQASHVVTEIAQKVIMQRCGVSGDIESEGPIGSAARMLAGKQAYELDLQQQCCGGLNFGYFYKDSPIIKYDDEDQPAYTMHDFTPSTIPGCRAPHLWLRDHRSLYDALGPDYTLIRIDRTTRIFGLVEAAARRGLPLRVLDIDEATARPLYKHKLVLVRPDQHVAWRGDEEPTHPVELVDLVRGACCAPAGESRATGLRTRVVGVTGF